MGGAAFFLGLFLLVVSVFFLPSVLTGNTSGYITGLEFAGGILLGAGVALLGYAVYLSSKMS
jgi:hypothetical protein